MVVVFYELAVLYAMVLAFLNRYVQLSEGTEVLLVVTLEGLIAVGIVLCLLRTSLFYC
jgi:hypothetical protein